MGAAQGALGRHVTQVGGGLFAANAPGAKHRNPALTGRVEIFADIRREFAKRGGIRLQRMLEAADIGFVIVTDIDDGHIGIADQAVPVARLDVSAGLVGIDAVDAEGDDLALQLDARAVKRRLVVVRQFAVQVAQPRIAAQVVEQRVDCLRVTGDRAVDALGGE